MKPINVNEEKNPAIPTGQLLKDKELNAAPSFTLGPWEVGGTWSNDIWDRSKGETTVIYAECIPLARTIWILNSGEYARSQKQAEANARLIAAAPALYKALQLLQKHVHDRHCDPHPMGQSELCKVSSDALSSVEGGQ